MNINDKFWPEVNVEMCKVPDFGREIRLVGSTIQVLVIKKDQSFWVNASELKGENDANDFLINRLLSELQWQQIKRGISKAEMKRRIMDHKIISK